ncbi:MAG TPA: IclR family transcriptional regulator [Bacilli bacterium]
MEQKYWVPAVKKANDVLQILAAEPYQNKLIDLSKRLQINKSSMFSLLQTMERLGWVVRDKGDTYALGAIFGQWGNAYFKQYDLIRNFHLEAIITKEAVGETIQLAKLERHEILYLAKEEAPTPVRLASEPGMKFPAHATALGKAMLAQLPDDELKAVYANVPLRSLTPHTISSFAELVRNLRQVKENGLAFDLEEAVTGFCCVAAFVNAGPLGLAAVSCSIPVHQWEMKKERAAQAIRQLAARLSLSGNAP